MAETQGTGRYRRLSPQSLGVALALLPGTAFLYTFLYEYGFGHEFGIPPQLMTVSWTTALVTLGALLAVLWPLIFFLIFVDVDPRKPLGPKSADPIYTWVYVYVALGLALGALAWLYGPLWRHWLGFLIIYAALGFVRFGIPLFKRGDAPYKEKLKGYIHSERREHSTFLVELTLRLGVGPLFVGILAGAILFFSAGQASALRQDTFFVLDEVPARVVLRIYGDRLAVARFDPKTRRVERRLGVISLSGSNVTMGLEKVGPLKLAEEGK